MPPWYTVVTAPLADAIIDIKVKEQSIENMMKGKMIFEPPRYMSVNRCCEQLMEVEADHGQGLCGPDQLAVGVSRVGSPDQQIVYGTLAELAKVDFGTPLHSLVLVADVDHIEQAVLDSYKINESTPRLSEE